MKWYAKVEVVREPCKVVRKWGVRFRSASGFRGLDTVRPLVKGRRWSRTPLCQGVGRRNCALSHKHLWRKSTLDSNPRNPHTLSMHFINHPRAARLDLREIDTLAVLGLRLPGEATDQRRLACERHARHEACEVCIDYFLGDAHESRNAPAGARYGRIRLARIHA